MFEHVIIPIDFSPATGAVVERAAQLKETGTRCARLLHVMDITHSARSTVGHRDLYLQDIAHFAEVLREVQMKVEVSVPMGYPVEQILEQAKQVDLVLMGTRGQNAAKRIFVGSTAVSVARRASVPVLLEAIGPEGGSSSEERLFDHILLATDGSEAAQGAERMAADLAEEGAQVTTLAVVGDEQEKARARDYLDDLSATLDMNSSEEVVISGNAVRAIINTAEERGATLFLIGKRGRTRDVLLGSTANALIRNSYLPVLVVPGSYPSK